MTRTDSLQRLHARPGPQPIGQAVPLEDPLHRSRIRPSPEIAEPREHAPGLVHAHHLDQVFAELCQGV